MTYSYTHDPSGNSGFTPSGRHWAEEYYFIKKLETPSAWFAPNETWEKGPEGQDIRPLTIHIGERNERPTWDEPVFDVARYRKAKQLYREGRLSKDSLDFSPWLSTEWEEAAKIRNDELRYGKSYINSPFRSASGVITMGDSPAINVIQILGEILGEDNRQYVMEQAVTRVATPNLTLSVDSWHGFTASQDIAEGEEALVKKGKFTRQEYMLKKDVAHIASTDEGQMRADRDVFAQHVRHAVGDLRRLKAQKIATELETATNVAGSDWLAWTGDHRTTDAAMEIAAAARVIEANGGVPDTIASHSRTFNAFAVNTAGPMAPAQNQRFGTGVVGGIPALTGFTWYIDNLKTETLVTVYDKSAILLMQGPTRTAQYRIEGRGIDAYITRDWNAVKIIDGTRVRDVTGVLT